MPVDYQQIANDNIANQIHGFTIDYFTLIKNSRSYSECPNFWLPGKSSNPLPPPPPTIPPIIHQIFCTCAIGQNTSLTEYFPAKPAEYPRIFPNFQNCARCERDLKDNKDHLKQKCARIFVRGHYLFREATNVRKFSLRFQGPKIFNSINDEIKNSLRLLEFTTK